MKTYYFKVFIDGKEISFKESVEKGVIQLHVNGFFCDERIEIKKFCDCFDIFGKEIFENDKVKDLKGNTYTVQNLNGDYYLLKENDKIYSRLSSLKCLNKIDFIKVSNN